MANATAPIFMDSTGQAIATALNTIASKTINLTTIQQLGISATPAELNVMDGITATTAELNVLDGITASTAELNVMDGITATTAELNVLDGITATTEELNYVDGVTSAIQTQLDARATLDSGKVTASQASSTIVWITASATVQLSDAGKLLCIDTSSAVTITIPTNASVAIPVGTEIEIVRWNTGTVTISPASGVTIVSTETARTISAQYGVVAMKQIATDIWIISGALG